MAEWMIVGFAPVSKKLDLELAEGFVKAVLGEQGEFKIDDSTKEVPLENVVSAIYNGGRGTSVDVLIKKPIYLLSLGLYFDNNKTEGRLLIDRALFHEEGDEQSPAVKDFIQRCVRAYNFLHPPYGRGYWEGVFDQQSVEGWKAFPESVNDVKGNLKHIFWLNFYGPELARQIGEYKIKTAPYARTIELSDGGILLIRGEHPNEYSESFHGETIRRHLFGPRSLLDRIQGK